MGKFYYGSPKNSQNDLVHALIAVKQHNIRASCISMLAETWAEWWQVDVEKDL